MFGILTLKDFLHGPVETVPQLMVVLGGAAVVTGITYFRVWKWLYREWVTHVDHK